MGIAAFEGKSPRIGGGTYVHPSADLFGDVEIGAGCWIGPGARLRGDYGTIRVGDRTSIEDNCVIHARPGEVCTIGNWVTIGHGAIIHNALRIEDYAVIGMGAIVSDWTIVGEWAVVGEGAVVRQRQAIPAGAIAVGIPARLLEKEVEEAYKAEWMHFKQTYVDLARRYPSGLLPLDDSAGRERGMEPPRSGRGTSEKGMEERD
ncbi:MAG: gamma carbonic anhydrase family protein [Candidatus Eisenbacteria bacterium]|nr:gamma carbonic anhydrase family protein [Candidatus Eisenbacteria bacterium]